MVFVTVFISTVIYVRNVKSNKILPSHRIIRRKRKPRRQDEFQQPFREERCGGKFRNEDLEISTADNINCNNNVKGCSHRAPPLPPNAPFMPPPLPSHYRPGDRVREWTVPTVSASVASKTKKISLRSKDNPVNTALVSELKLRLEQKNMANRYWWNACINTCSVERRRVPLPILRHVSSDWRRFQARFDQGQDLSRRALEASYCSVYVLMRESLAGIAGWI